MTSTVRLEEPIPIAQNTRAETPETKTSKDVYNPYLAARREWDERYGHFISRERNWRLMAILSSLVALVSVGGMIHLSTKSHIVPFVVAMDSLGRTAAAGPADETSPADDRLKRATLFNWVEDLRTVTSDGIAQRKAIDRVYAHIASGGQAQAFISEFYRADPPQKRAAAETVSVEVRSVLPTSERTFEVEWMETARDLYGAVKGQDHWKAAFSIAVNPPTDERMARINPLSIYITNASWGKVLWARKDSSKCKYSKLSLSQPPSLPVSSRKSLRRLRFKPSGFRRRKLNVRFQPGATRSSTATISVPRSTLFRTRTRFNLARKPSTR